MSRINVFFLWTILKVSCQALMAYKARSLLTMLGIIIGIGAVIVMISVGRGANLSIQQQIDNLGSNMLMIFPGSVTRGGVRSGFGTKPTLRVSDAIAIARECPSVLRVTYARRRVLQVVAGSRNWGTFVAGVSPDWVEVRNWPLMSGEFFTEGHMKSAAKVSVLGYTVAEKLFEPWEEVVGSTIRIKNVPFRVIGVLTPKGRTPNGNDQDDAVFIPFTTAERKVFGSLWPGSVGFIGVSAVSREEVPLAKEQIQALLRQRHRIMPGAEDDFSVRTLDEFAQMAARATGTMTLLLTSVAAVSLIVGGIGIMNIMLVSVTERTREIGIRMAVGASSMDILLQFLVEALTLSMMGGILGIICGIVASRMISLFAGWPSIVAADSVIIATLFSGSVGVFFGFYPARKASMLDPIDALRYE